MSLRNILRLDSCTKQQFATQAKLGQHRLMKLGKVEANMVQIQGTTGHPLLLATESIPSKKGFRDGQIACVLSNKSLDMIYQLENHLADQLCDWSKQHLSDGLDEARRTEFARGNYLLRPTIREGYNCVWLSKAMDIKYFDQYGKPIAPVEDGKPGLYKLLIKAFWLYLGPHGSTQYNASLHLRVTQVVYAEPDSHSVGEECLLLTPSLIDNNKALDDTVPCTSNDDDSDLQRNAALATSTPKRKRKSTKQSDPSLKQSKPTDIIDSWDNFLNSLN